MSFLSRDSSVYVLCIHEPVIVYCLIYAFYRLHIVENSQPLITVEGFSNYSDVNTDDIVPWTPLRAGWY